MTTDPRRAGPGTPQLDPLQLDLATAVVRLEQAAEQRDATGHISDWLADRILTCDLPRLRRHLSDDALTLIADVQRATGRETV